MRSVLAFAVSAGLAASNVQAQHVISNKRSCTTCRIELRAIATIGSEVGPGYLKNTSSQIFLDSRGRYWVLESGSPPRVFAANGAYIKTIGRIGQGPGEFMAPGSVFAVGGDSTAIFDQMGRITLVGPDLRIAREIPPPINDIMEGLTLTWPGKVVVNAFTSSPVGLSLHLLSFASPNARSTKSFGSKSELPPIQRYPQLRTYMTPSKQGGFWTVIAGRYELTRWSSDGGMLDQLVRKPAWFAKESGWNMGSREKPPEPRINGIKEDDAGLLWVYFSIASPTYSRGWQRAPGGTAETSTRNIDYDSIFITRIEVIDPVQKRLVATATIHKTIKGVLPGNKIVYYTTKNEAPLAAVYKPELLR